MTQRRSFDKDYLRQEFNKIDAIAQEPMTIYLIGGGAMAFYGLKAATKDIDIILCTEEDVVNLKTVLDVVGYKDPNPITITRPYNKMQTNIMLENIDGFRWDVFLTKVCGKIALSEDMQNRANSLYQGNRLKVFIASKEDLFLFKAITTRDADLDDTRILAQSGLNWTTIAQECKKQSQRSGLCWEDALCQTLDALKTAYSIQAPIEKVLRKTAEQKVIMKALLEQIGKGNNNVQSIAKAIKEPASFVRIELNKLVKRGSLKKDKSKRPYEFKME